MKITATTIYFYKKVRMKKNPIHTFLNEWFYIINA